MPDQWGNATTADMAQQARDTAAQRLRQGAIGQQQPQPQIPQDYQSWGNLAQIAAQQFPNFQNWTPGQGPPPISEIEKVMGMAGITTLPYNMQMLEEAQRLSRAGRDAGEIWRRTQTELSPLDYNWTQEIPGAKGRFKSIAQLARETNAENPGRRLGDYINHPELFNLQPQMQDWHLIADPHRLIGNKASFTAGTEYNPPAIRWNPYLLTKPEEFLASMNHELQHGYNWLTNRPRGLSPEEIRRMIRFQFPGASPLDVESTAYSHYRLQPTEQEARLSSWRGRMLPIQRQAISPYESLQHMLERERYP